MSVSPYCGDESLRPLTVVVCFPVVLPDSSLRDQLLLRSGRSLDERRGRCSDRLRRFENLLVEVERLVGFLKNRCDVITKLEGI